MKPFTTARRSSAIMLCGALALAVGSGCAATTVKTTWKAPEAGRSAFRKILVVVASQDQDTRHTGEDEVVGRIRTTSSAEAVPSYLLFPNGAEITDEAARARLAELGFDGVMVFRVRSVEEKVNRTPGTFEARPNFAYGGWPLYDPGYATVDTVVRVETQVYSVRDDKLIWAAVSRSVDPGSTRRLVTDVSRAVEKRLKKEGLLA